MSDKWGNTIYSLLEQTGPFATADSPPGYQVFSAESLLKRNNVLAHSFIMTGRKEMILPAKTRVRQPQAYCPGQIEFVYQIDQKIRLHGRGVNIQSQKNASAESSENLTLPFLPVGV